MRGFRYHLAAESLFLDGRVEGGATFGGQPVHAPRDPLQITRSGEVGHGPACTALVDGNAGGRDLLPFGVGKLAGLRHVRLRLNATRLLDSSEELQHRFVGGVLREKGHGFNFL